jgi:hypothetical protein
MIALLLSALLAVDHSPQLYRFPILERPGDRPGTCRVDVTDNQVLRSAGINRMVDLNLAGEPARQFSVSVGAGNRIIAVSVFYSISAGKSRREGESIYALYSTSGFDSGTRRYTTTGIPARRDEDRLARLTPAEADSTLTLARMVLRRCGVMSSNS